jgi:hypothetical protein
VRSESCEGRKSQKSVESRHYCFRETEGRETEFAKEVPVCSKREGGSVNQIICCSVSEGESWTLGAIGVQAFNFLRGREGEGISW